MAGRYYHHEEAQPTRTELPPQQVRIWLCGPFQIAWGNTPNEPQILSLTDLQNLWEGLSAGEFGDFNVAAMTFAQAKTLAPNIVPERIRLEIVNHQATTAIANRNMDEFEHYLIAGAHGAATLGSQKRRQEVVANWKLARQIWPHELRVLQLSEYLV